MALPNVEHLVPAVPSNYEKYAVQGIEVYIPILLPLEKPLKFVLKKFLMVKYIDVEGVKLF